MSNFQAANDKQQLAPMLEQNYESAFELD